MAAQRWIVAEVSKNWPEEGFAGQTLGQLFELVIERNHQRGYRLHSWKLDRWSPEPGKLNECIIAVFEHTKNWEEL